MAEKRSGSRSHAGALERAANPKYVQLLRLLADIVSVSAKKPDSEEELREGSLCAIPNKE